MRWLKVLVGVWASATVVNQVLEKDEQAPKKALEERAPEPVSGYAVIAATNSTGVLHRRAECVAGIATWPVAADRPPREKEECNDCGMHKEVSQWPCNLQQHKA